MSPKIIDKHQRKLDIVQASLTLFESHPIAKTSIAMIASEANLSKGSFYELFENKTSLIIYIINSTAQEMEQALTPLLQANISAYEKLTGFFMGAIEKTLQGGVISDVAFELWRLAYIEKEPAASKVMEEFLDIYMTLFDTILKEGINNKEFIEHDTMHSARAIGAMIDGLQLQAVVRSYDILPTAQEAITTYLKGLQS